MMINNDISQEKKQKRVRAPLKMIENLKTRTYSYKKRKECILKKTRELATLCDVKACTICIGPDGKVETWPENSTQVKDVISEYTEYVKFGKKDKSVGSFSDNNIGSILEGEKNLENLSARLNSKLREVNDRIELLKKEKILANNYAFNSLDIMGSNNISPVNETNYDCMCTEDISMANENCYTINEESQIIDPGFTYWYEDPRFSYGGEFDFLVGETGFGNMTCDPLTCC